MVITLSLTGFALPMLIIAKRAGRLSDRFGPRVTSVGAAAVTVPIMASYGFVSWVPVIMLMALPHGIMEAIQSPGTQAAVADAAPARGRRCRAGARGGGRVGGRAIGALTAAPLFAWLGSGPTWLIAGLVMGSLLLTISASSTHRCSSGAPPPGAGGGAGRADVPRVGAARRAFRFVLGVVRLTRETDHA